MTNFAWEWPSVDMGRGEGVCVRLWDREDREGYDAEDEASLAVDICWILCALVVCKNGAEAGFNP